MKKCALPLALSALTLISVEALAAGPPFLPIASTTGGGLAPTTWGFASSYQGTDHGTGYSAFRVDHTNDGDNLLYGYTYNAPPGFISDIRAIYVFDVAGLDGQSSPVWSAFMFNPREIPTAPGFGQSVFAEIALVSSGGVHRLTGLSSFDDNNAANLDIYDAEDFENGDPFANPELAFSGAGQTLIGTMPIMDGKVTVPIDFVVTDAVNNDLGIGGPPVVEVPVLSLSGIAALALLLGLAGVSFLRR